MPIWTYACIVVCCDYSTQMQKNLLYCIYMIISFHGGQTLRFQTGDIVLGCNPSLPPHGSKVSKFGANIVLCSSFASEHHNTELCERGEDTPFVIDGPGSYEYMAMTFQGEPMGKSSKDMDALSTMYRFTMDDIDVVVCGAVIPKSELNPDGSVIFSEPDILVIPIDAEHTRDIDEFINFTNPKMIIPVNRWSNNDAATMLFLKSHAFHGNAEPKLTLKKRDIDAMSKNPILLSL